MSPQAPDIVALIARLAEAGEDFCVATVVRTENATSAKAGAKAVVLADGRLQGFLGGACVQGAVRRCAAEALASGEPRLIRVKPSEEVVTRLDRDGTELHKSGCPSGGTVDLFVEPMRPAPRLLVCGGAPVAWAVADLGRRLGWRVVAAAAPEDMEGCDPRDQAHPGFELADLALGPRDAVVVATQGRRDREALAAALDSEAGYLAFVGSRRKAAALLDRLRQQGVAEERLARLKAPAGLDIGAIEPAEIALSILGEIVAWRRRGARLPVPRAVAAEGGT